MTNSNGTELDNLDRIPEPPNLGRPRELWTSLCDNVPFLRRLCGPNQAAIELVVADKVKAESLAAFCDNDFWAAGGNRVGQMITRVFAGLLFREFGENAFRIERTQIDNLQSDSTRQLEEVCA